MLLHQEVIWQAVVAHAADVAKPLQSSLPNQLFHRGLLVTLTTYHTVAETIMEGHSENLTQTAHLEDFELVEVVFEDDPGLRPIEKNGQYQCTVQADFGVRVTFVFSQMHHRRQAKAEPLDQFLNLFLLLMPLSFLEPESRGI